MGLKLSRGPYHGPYNGPLKSDQNGIEMIFKCFF